MALAGRVRRLELRFEVGHVVVAVAVARRLAQADAIDDRCVVQRVGNDRVVLVEQRLEHAAVGVECGRVQDGVFGTEELRERLFQFLVHGLGAADEAHRRQAVAVLGQRGFGRFLRLGIARQAQVVIRAHVDQGAAVFRLHLGALARGQHALGLEQALVAQGRQIVLQASIKGVLRLFAHVISLSVVAGLTGRWTMLYR